MNELIKFLNNPSLLFNLINAPIVKFVVTNPVNSIIVATASILCLEKIRDFISKNESEE